MLKVSDGLLWRPEVFWNEQWTHSRLHPVASQEHISILAKEVRWLGRLLQG